MRERGFEPRPLSGLDPKSSASASSATLARLLFSGFSGRLSRLNRNLEGVVKLLGEALDKAFVGKAEIDIPANDKVVQDLNHHELGSPHQISGQSPILRGRCRIPRWMVMNENEGGSFRLKSLSYDLSWVDGTACQSSIKEILIGNKLIFPIQKKHFENLLFHVSHRVEKIIKHGSG